MIRPLLATVAVAMAAVTAPAVAQTAIQPGTIVGTFGAMGYPQGTVIYTVPNDRYARVTDIRILNFGSVPCYFHLELGTNAVAYYGVNTQYQTISDHMVSGYGLVPGDTVRGYTAGCSSNTSILVELRGFNFTIP